jgi:hypothetical protein
MLQKTVIGVFSDSDDAEDAIETLRDEDYNPKDISIVMQNAREGEVIANNTGASVADGAATGATTGAVLGGIAGLLIGIGAIAIPGIGAILIGGPLAAALGLSGAAATTVSGAATGALAGGLLGALMGLGVPEEDARVYENRVKAGGILVAVPARPGEEGDVESVLEENGADTIRTLSLRDAYSDESRDEEEGDDIIDSPVDESPRVTGRRDATMYAGRKGGRSIIRKRTRRR